MVNTAIDKNAGKEETPMAHAMQELMDMKIWVLWMWSKNRKGKTTKLPIALDGKATGTSENWSHTWGTWDEASMALKCIPQAAGVGFIVPKGYFFLDKDDADLEHPVVKLLLSRFSSYAELSVSGNGIHIYGKCDFNRIPVHYVPNKRRYAVDSDFYVNNRSAGLEVYFGGVTNHFAAFTGNAVLDLPLKDCTEAVLVTMDKDMRKQPKVRYSAKRDGDNKEAFQIVEALRHQKNSEKFIRLFDEGDISDYGSASEADAALCALVAFRTGPDPDLIREIIFNSALVRDKWQREEYIEATIAAGIDACHGNFIPSKMEHPDFIRFRGKGEPYVHSALLAKWTREHLEYKLVRDNGKQAVLIYVYENGVYRLYAPEMLKGVIKSYIAAYDEELVSMPPVNEAFNQIITDLNYVPQEALNSNEHIINFQNGILTVTPEGLTLSEHTPDILSTIQIPCHWTGKESPTPVFDAYLKRLVNDDPGVENLLLEFIGAVLSNVKGYRMKKALFMVGDGDTGKSQLKSLAEWLVGAGNFLGIDLREIEARFGTGAIYGTRLAGSSDMSFLSVDELKTFKKITGGDSLFAELKGQQGFQYTYNGLLWFCMNKLPKFGGDDGKWVYDRILVVDCPNVIPKAEQDKTLLDRMYAERDGIVYKCVKALQRVMANGYRFTEPVSVQAARVAYMEDNNTVITFFNTCMAKRKDGANQNDGFTVRKIYKVYKAFCRDNNNGFAKSEKEFKQNIANHLGISVAELKVERRSGTYFKDFTLSETAKKDYTIGMGYVDGDVFL